MPILKNTTSNVMLAGITSTSLVAAGFFVNGIGFAWSVVPFILALICREKLVRSTLIAPYFAGIALIAGWGLVAMGHPALFVVAGAIVLIGLLTALLIYGGVAIGLLVLAFVPYFPGHPLLAVGAVAPNGGLMAIATVLVLVALIEKLSHIRHRVAAVGVLAVGLGIWNVASHLQGEAVLVAASGQTSNSAPSWTEVPLSLPLDISDRLRMEALRAEMEPNGIYVTGENILRSSDQLALEGWCRFAHEQQVAVFLGVEDNVTGRPGVALIKPDHDCATMPLVYAAWIGIPEITGNWFPFKPIDFVQDDYAQGIEWLACFEGFSLAAWVKLGLSQPQSVIIVSNDYWTEPLPVSALRRKISANFERLFGIAVYHADTGRNLLKQSEAL